MRPKRRAARAVAVEVARHFCGRLHSQLLPLAVALLALTALIVTTKVSRADKGGVGFWLSGIYGSLAAVPQAQPGWAFATFNYFTSVSASGNLALSREIEVGRVPVSFTGSANLNLHSTADFQAVVPSYAFATPVLGGQAAVSLMALYGGSRTNVSGTINGTVTGPGGSMPFMRSDSITDSVTGFGDLYPTFALRWNAGVNNYMVYMTGDIPVGLYNSASLANMGNGHGAFDAGAGHTYFDQKTGHEFSFVTGFAYNFPNIATDYRNGIDWHLDWGASQFLTKQWQVGLVGYFYKQITPDHGCLPTFCPFELQVISIGPQLGYIFPVGGMQGYVNLKAYGEFDGHDRPSAGTLG